MGLPLLVPGCPVGSIHGFDPGGNPGGSATEPGATGAGAIGLGVTGGGVPPPVRLYLISLITLLYSELSRLIAALNPASSGEPGRASFFNF